MPAIPLPDKELCELLLAVGAEPGTSAADFGRSFDELGLDSLAVTEMASRLQKRIGVDVEAELDEHTTPGELLALVTARLAAEGAA